MIEYKVRDRVLFSIKNLVQQISNREIKKLTKKFVRPCKINKIILENVVELELPASIKLHLVVYVSRIVLYQEQVEQQKKISSSLVEIDRKKV